MSSALHCHDMFSLLDGYATPQENLDRAREIGLKAFAITNHGNEYSWCYYDKLREDYPDIKMIYGVELYECFDTAVKDKDSKYFHLIALAKNEEGRKALNRIVTKSNLDDLYFKPRTSIAEMAPYGKDLVVSTACLASKLAREENYETCIKYINEYKQVFPYFYLEMQSHSHPDQEKYNNKILQLSKDTNTPYIITCDSHAARREDLIYQGRHVQIAHDAETMSEIYEGCYLQSDDEIHEIMDGQIGKGAVDIGLTNTDSIADIIDVVRMPFQEPQLPTFPLPNGFTEDLVYLKYLISIGWEQRGFNKFAADKQNKYQERMDYELEVIHNMGFDGYFLIVWDFIKYARDNNVMVGSGRGSCAGSLVCYALGITDLDPIKYGLIFERFLNPERISMPDTDTDVSDREKVINYLVSKYGEHRVCQIINFSYITPIVAIKDVGKVLGFKYAEMDKLSKKFVYNTFHECLDNNKQMVSDNPQYAELFDIASHLSGRVKTVSCHAGGVGIVDTDINDYMAMKLGSDGEHVIQVDKKIIEDIGIIKFDILGVQTLNMVKEVLDDLDLPEYSININNPDFEDSSRPYELLSKALTNGVFQVESAGMKDLLIRLQASNMEDLSAVLALYRPDSMGALEEFIECKHDPSKVKYLHPDMEPILKSTYGCMIYQEQLLDIVRVFGGRSYGGADIFRKAIGKKDPELVKLESEKLYLEIIENGYDEHVAKAISDSLSTKGGYLFNKSHSYSYAVLCLQTAYLKIVFTLHFFKALFNLNKDKAGMLNKYIIDARLFKIEVLPPHINKSGMNFSISGKSILFGLSAVSGIGEKIAFEIISHRDDGSFVNFDDFKSRVKPKKSQVISLVKAGAIPTKNKKRLLINYLKSLYEPLQFKPVISLPTYQELLVKWNIDKEQFRNGTKRYDFDKDRMLQILNQKKEVTFNEQQEVRYKKYIEDNRKYLDNEAFWEFEALQIFINDNPFEQAYSYMTKQFEEVESGEMCTIVGVIAHVQKKKDKNKNTFAYANIYSSFGITEAIIWSSQLREYEDLIVKGKQIAMYCKKDSDEKVIAEKIKPYHTWLLDIKRQKGVA